MECHGTSLPVSGEVVFTLTLSAAHGIVTLIEESLIDTVSDSDDARRVSFRGTLPAVNKGIATLIYKGDDNISFHHLHLCL